ncbi:MAG: hypothetical protein Kow0092_19780 [Deferrisomatales bacterium]
MRAASTLLWLLLLLAPAWARATEEYADATGQGCGVCHLDPLGGGALTPRGEAFAAGGHRWPPPLEARPQRPRSRWTAAARFACGLAHTLAGFLWFGTIFYVHLVLRPTYAKGGLPRTEVRIAWACMAVLAATGVALTLWKVPGPGALWTTRWGRLLLVKVALFSFLVASAAYVVLVLSPKLRRLRSGWQRNDGLEGRPAWVKVGDRLYDLSKSPRWPQGSHFGRHQAGADLTEALKGAPHGPEKLDGFPVFSLTGGALHRESQEVRALYVLAYVNLAVAVGVVVVLALWRWG